MRNDIYSFSASGVLHIGLSILLLSMAGTSAVLQQPEPAQPVELVEVAGASERSGTKVQEKDPEGDLPCAQFYGGIGIMGEPLIMEVYPGYPADRAGIQKGDLIYSDGHNIRGEPGTDIMVRIYRDKIETTLTLTREKICYE